MVESLWIPKRFGTYADTFLMLGLAQIAEFACGQIGQDQAMQLIDEGSAYRITLAHSADLDAIATLPYFEVFPPVAGAKTDTSKLPKQTPIYDAVAASDRRKLYKEAEMQRRQGKDLPELAEDLPPPDPRTQNAVILTSMRHDRNHNGLWLDTWDLGAHFGSFMAVLLAVFGTPDPARNLSDRVQAEFQRRTGQKLPGQASAVKVYLPTSVQGVNRLKADTNKMDSQKTDWLSLWLIAGGFFEFALSERIKIAEGSYDWRVVALAPKDISLNDYRRALNRLRVYNAPGGGHGIARFDAELTLNLASSLLEYHPAKATAPKARSRRSQRRAITEWVSDFSGTHFGSKGQVYGVKEVFSLGLPDWVAPECYQDIIDYQRVLQEHLRVVRSLSVEAGHSELLNTYRDFITGRLPQFFPFQVRYADYVIRHLADANARPPRLFTVDGLNLMIQKESDFQTIVQNPSFLRIAKAINQATVFAGKVRTQEGTIDLPWERQYGLAQKLSNYAGSKTDFVSAIAEFLAKYEHENLRIAEQLQKEGKTLRRVWTTKADLDGLIALLEQHNVALVANLLIAYGYARWTKPKASDSSDSSDDEGTVGDADPIADSPEA